MTNRIIYSQYPGKVASTGGIFYIRIPKEVIDRMRLSVGQELDVTVKIPLYEEPNHLK